VALPDPIRRDGRLRWQQVVVSLPTVLSQQLAVGAARRLSCKASPTISGAGEMRKVHLYDQERPPTRVGKLKLETKFVFHNEGTLFNTHTTIHAAPGVKGGSQPHSGTHSLGGGLVQQPWGQWDSPLTLSAAERAILELLDEVPQRETFHQADILMEGLRTLSPKRLQKLLVECRSVKVTRLFL
jgi:hypothetical protein